MQIHRLALDVGLSEHEALAYEHLLLKGKSLVTPIAAALKMSRPNAYVILAQLERRGLAIPVAGSKKMYEAAPPRRLLELASEQEEDAREAKERISGALDALSKAFALTTDRPIVWTGEGLTALRTVYQDILHCGEKELLIFVSNFDRNIPEYSELIDDNIEKQFRMGIRSRALIPTADRGLKDPALGKALTKKGISMRLALQMKQMDLPAQILVFGPCVSITTFHEEFMTTVIRQPQIAETFRVLFEMFWQKGEDIGG